jgi:ABC-type taurine transport system substrate-binding protein
MTEEKDAITNSLRSLILHNADFLTETNRADTLMITLSFQSLVKPERHAWIDTKMGSDGEGYTVDLEDWAHQESWDNAVASIDTELNTVACAVTHAWLRGDSLDRTLNYAEGSSVQRK